MTDVAQTNRTLFSDHCRGSERQSSAVWAGFIEQTTSVSPCVGREHWAVRPLGLERSSRDQAKRHFALATFCFREDYCKIEQGIGLLIISIRQRAANLD